MGSKDKDKTTKEKSKVLEDIENAHLDPYKSFLRDIAQAYASSDHTAEALDQAFYVLTMAKQFDQHMADTQDKHFWKL